MLLVVCAVKLVTTARMSPGAANIVPKGKTPCPGVGLSVWYGETALETLAAGRARLSCGDGSIEPCGETPFVDAGLNVGKAKTLGLC